MQEINLAVKKRIGGVKTKLLMPLNGDLVDVAGNIVAQSAGVSYVDGQKFGQKGASFTRTGFVQINKNPRMSNDCRYEAPFSPPVAPFVLD